MNLPMANAKITTSQNMTETSCNASIASDVCHNTVGNGDTRYVVIVLSIHGISVSTVTAHRQLDDRYKHVSLGCYIMCAPVYYNHLISNTKVLLQLVNFM